jgi:hypothetical protein
MRKTRLFLALSLTLLLAGCVNDSASYLIDGRDHSLTVRREQQYFWKKDADISLVASRLPDCQRLHALTDGAVDDVKVDLYNAGEGLWNVRVDQQLWQIETQTCNGLTELQYDPKADLGQLVGSFVVRNGKLVFDAAPATPPVSATAGGTAAAPADAAAEAEAPAPASATPAAGTK